MVTSNIERRRAETHGEFNHAHHQANRFMFSTGIECSYPVITGRDGKS